MAWYSGGHVGFFFAGQISAFVESALAESGLVASESTAVLSLTSSSAEAEAP